MKMIIIVNWKWCNKKGGIALYSLGIDIGYSSIKIALINHELEVVESSYSLHKGRVKENIDILLKQLMSKYGEENIRFGAVTGQGSKFISEKQEVTWVNEVTSLVEGSLKKYPQVKSVVEIGGQSSKYITNLDNNDRSNIKISMNTNCAAGTGSFIEEQVSRLGINLENFSEYVGKATFVPRIAGRCSVFAKTDIIHHQQEGTDVKDILLGLSYALVKNYRANVVKKNPIKTPILITGGVAYNKGIVDALKDVLKVNSEDVIVARNCGNVAALGAAILGSKEKLNINLQAIIDMTKENKETIIIQDSRTSFPQLNGFGINDSQSKHLCRLIESNEKVHGYIGIDIGSTSTNVVFMDEDNQVVAFKYLRTLGDPMEAVRKGLLEIKEDIGKDLVVLGVGTTGSGRHMVGKYVGADVIIDEITAQAKAASSIDKDVDTIIEIGGQDSKFIKLEKGVVTDFEMNKICAAGTGSFIEEQANKLNIPITDFGNLAISSTNPTDLGDRCTVFIETNIAAAISKEAKIQDIAAGLSYSIVKNYLNKVVGKKEIGKKVFFQGGVANNQAVINAFRAILGNKIEVPKFFSVTGAYGVAILTKEQMQGSSSGFKGFDLQDRVDFKNSEDTKVKEENNRTRIFEEIEKLYLKGYHGTIDPSKKTVGIPRVLFLDKLFPMFNTFFKELGFNVVLSDITNEKTVELSQEFAMEETCYPVKLINGHVAQLMERNVDYIFLPSLYTMAHEVSKTRQNYGCVYMQCIPRLVNKTMELEQKGIELLEPSLSFKFGKKYMMKTLIALGGKLKRNPIQTTIAITKGMMSLKEFEKEVEDLGEKAVKSLGKNEKAFVIVTRGYGITDPILNMGIPEKLEKMGYKVLTLSNLPAHDHDTSKEHPNMYWPFGQHILSGAQIIRQHPNLYPIYITNHGCGPDTVLAHYFKEEMKGKPYLNIEVDEHFSSVGVLTRVEAFINSLKSEKIHNEDSSNLKHFSDIAAHKHVNIKNKLEEVNPKTALYLPHMYPYSDLLASYLRPKGYNVKVISETTEKTVDLGRKFTISKEYLSFTGLVGDILAKAKELKDSDEQFGFIIPTLEGSEAGGQYHRLLRDKLDGEGFEDTQILSPFIEDIIKNKISKDMFLILLSGDLINMASRKDRKIFFNKFKGMIENNELSINNLKDIAKEIVKINHDKRKLLAVGEVNVLYNDFLNNNTLKNFEEQGIQVTYTPLSEYMWFIWREFLFQKDNEKEKEAHENLKILADYIKIISDTLGSESVFEKNLEKLVKRADEHLGLYTGGNGRYRIAKVLSEELNVRGIITLSSMYENTNTILNILTQGNVISKPLLNLGFDGNQNEIDQSKIDSFIYYTFKNNEIEDNEERKGA